MTPRRSLYRTAAFAAVGEELPAGVITEAGAQEPGAGQEGMKVPHAPRAKAEEMLRLQRRLRAGFLALAERHRDGEPLEVLVD